MLRICMVFFSLCALCACATVVPVAQAKPTAPIEIDYNQPETVDAGDEITTILDVTATARLTGLKVKVVPYRGLELVSGEQEIRFEAMAKGDKQAIPVTIRMLDNEVGYLSVFATTTTSRGERTRAAMLKFGQAGEVTLQRMKSGSVKDAVTGENLNIMKGDPR